MWRKATALLAMHDEDGDADAARLSSQLARLLMQVCPP